MGWMRHIQPSSDQMVANDIPNGSTPLRVDVADQSPISSGRNLEFESCTRRIAAFGILQTPFIGRVQFRGVLKPCRMFQVCACMAVKMEAGHQAVGKHLTDRLPLTAVAAWGKANQESRHIQKENAFDIEQRHSLFVDALIPQCPCTGFCACVFPFRSSFRPCP
jgi:hypothetical protein